MNQIKKKYSSPLCDLIQGMVELNEEYRYQILNTFIESLFRILLNI